LQDWLEKMKIVRKGVAEADTPQQAVAELQSESLNSLK
jgi:hypothetical protein